MSCFFFLEASESEADFLICTLHSYRINRWKYTFAKRAMPSLCYWLARENKLQPQAADSIFCHLVRSELQNQEHSRLAC